ncbi:MAG: leucine-rich repeat domain-containing protein, partial [Cytophagaceae bacterium]
MDTNTSSLDEDAAKNSEPWPPRTLNTTPQDTQCDAWKRMLDLVEQAAEDGRDDFRPSRELGWETWSQVITLPPTIAKLKSVKKLNLYGSNLVRIPPQIGEMTALEEFDPYTSYGLHWFPYEITRCPHLKGSTVSTRALYGNRNTHPPFPHLPSFWPELTPLTCSVCNGPFPTSGPLQCWISLRVATDVLPLLVHACSIECI